MDDTTLTHATHATPGFRSPWGITPTGSQEDRHEQESEPPRLCADVSRRRRSGGRASRHAVRRRLRHSAPAAVTGAAAGKQAAIARRLITPPAQGFGYGGGDIAGRGVNEPLQDASRESQAAAVTHPGGWKEGHTIPAEYYIDEKHYLADERFIGEHLWLMVDHESRIPNAGDYFVFEYGRGESAIVLRDRAGAVKAYYNVCRHRGSRLCRHDEDTTPKDPRLSVKQLGSSGNTPVFRCPYHAWTYDLDGHLMAAYGMPADFDPAKNGLTPCHVRTAEGFIFVNFSRQEPPDFESAVSAMRTLCQRYGTAQLKVGARIQYPTRANWKLALENFLECYHCGPAHRSLVTTHDWDYSITAEQRARREPEMERWVPPQVRPGGTAGMGQARNSRHGWTRFPATRPCHRIARWQARGAAAARLSRSTRTASGKRRPRGRRHTGQRMTITSPWRDSRRVASP